MKLVCTASLGVIRSFVVFAWVVSVVPLCAGTSGDWRQFMNSPSHTGNAADSVLSFPMVLNSQIRVDDSILTSPVVVDGLVYLVDQMGTAYCVNPETKGFAWKTNPDGNEAMGSNTSSPCVANGRMVYGTMTGHFYMLDIKTGKVVKALDLNWPILNSITYANDSFYFQTLEAVIYCVSLDGQIRWRWEQNRKFTENWKYRDPSDGSKMAWTRRRNSTQHGGVPVSVVGNKVVTSVGFDLICLEDNGTKAKLIWEQTSRQPMIPKGAAIEGDYLYVGYPGADGAGVLKRHSLADGSVAGGDVIKSYREDAKKINFMPQTQWSIFATPTVRNEIVYYSRHAFGVTSYDNKRAGTNGRGLIWKSFITTAEGLTPCVSSSILSRKHCLFTTLDGELIAVDLRIETTSMTIP